VLEKLQEKIRNEMARYARAEGEVGL